MRVFVSAIAVLSLAGIATPTLAQSGDIVVPAGLTVKEVRELEKLEKRRVDLQEDISDSEREMINAREKIAKSEARLAEAEGRLRDAQDKQEKVQRSLEKDQQKLAEVEMRLAQLRCEEPVELSRR